MLYGHHNSHVGPNSFSYKYTSCANWIYLQPQFVSTTSTQSWPWTVKIHHNENSHNMYILSASLIGNPALICLFVIVQPSHHQTYVYGFVGAVSSSLFLFFSMSLSFSLSCLLTKNNIYISNNQSYNTKTNSITPSGYSIPYLSPGWQGLVRCTNGKRYPLIHHERKLFYQQTVTT